MLIFSRTEVAFAIGLVTLLWVFLADESMIIATQRFFSGMNHFVLLAIPFFLLAGELMNEADITRRIIRISNATIGRFRGGLAQANIGASLLFARIVGAAIADVVAIGSVFIPAMAEEGYDRDFSAAVTTSSSLVGPIIPLSIIIVIYGAVTQTSIGALFVAAVIPGLILGLALMVIVAYIAYTRDLPRHEMTIDRSEYPRLAFDGIVALTMPGIILFGIVSGIFTPTEAAAVACVYAIILGVFLYRTLDLRGMYRSLRTSVLHTTQLYVIIGFATILSYMLARQGIPRLIAEAIVGAGLGAVGFMLLITVVLLFVGTWLEIGAATIMLAPTIASMVKIVGIHPYQFGIMFVITLNFGLLTLPIGMALFAASSVAKVPVWSIAKRITPFFVVDLVVLYLLIEFPSLTLWLPRTLGY